MNLDKFWLFSVSLKSLTENTVTFPDIQRSRDPGPTATTILELSWEVFSGTRILAGVSDGGKIFSTRMQFKV